MIQPLNPTITITVSGIEGSGKNRVLAIIEEALKYHLGRDIIIDSPTLYAKRETHTDWSKPRSGTIFKLEEANRSVSSQYGDTSNRGYHQAGNAVEEEHHDECKQENETCIRIIKLIEQQLNGSIDPVTARAIWYNVTKTDDITCLADHLSFALNYAVKRSYHTIMERGINVHGMPESSPEQEVQAENISRIYTSIISQLYGKTDIARAYKFWQKTLEEMRNNKSLLVEILIHVIADVSNQQDTV